MKNETYAVVVPRYCHLAAGSLNFGPGIFGPESSRLLFRQGLGGAVARSQGAESGLILMKRGSKTENTATVDGDGGDSDTGI